jgi:hypothetical protein
MPIGSPRGPSGSVIAGISLSGFGDSNPGAFPTASDRMSRCASSGGPT